jgi:hypothetical protein
MFKNAQVAGSARGCSLLHIQPGTCGSIIEIEELYTLYAPPNHRDGVVHQTRRDAEVDTEHFGGKTTE